MRDAPRDLVRLVHAVQAREPLPGDLAGWIIDLATASISDQERKQVRNRLLRQAGAIVGGSPWNQAKEVRTQMLEVIRLWTFYGRNPPPAESIKALAIEALTIDPTAPTSRTHLWRILGNITFIDDADESEPACEDRFHAQ